MFTFSRSGSDITGSILANGLKADLYENFTDVDAVYSVNPFIVERPKEIKELTYREMRNYLMQDLPSCMMKRLFQHSVQGYLYKLRIRTIQRHQEPKLFMNEITPMVL